MPKLTIDQRGIEVPAGTTLLEAARALGIEIPTLCHRQGYAPFTSCMVCMVKDCASGKMLPACSAAVQEGMDIRANGDEVAAARKDTLDLLLSEHVGNCEGPCRRGCPADVNIPWILTQIEQGRLEAAAAHLNRYLTFPSMVERICKAPCEKTCRRGEYDAAVSIRHLLRHVADRDLERGSPAVPRPASSRGKRVAVVGAGPTGLAAAYHLLLAGYDCAVLDEQETAGGTVRRFIPEAVLPRAILDAEIGKLDNLGARFEMKTRIGHDVSMEELRTDYDAVVLAVGKLKPESPAAFGLRGGPYGIEVRPGTFQASIDHVFSGGDAVRPFQDAARSVSDGRLVAESVRLYLSGEPPLPRRRRFNSRVGRLQGEELERFVDGYDRGGRVTPDRGAADGFTPAEALREAARCLHCECLKAGPCKLRLYADAYGARQDGYLHRVRATYSRVLQHADVIFEPGKCIKCGLCVRIARERGEPLGLTFVDRGFDVRVAVPFDDSMAEGLRGIADECVEACPTAALSFKREGLRRNQMKGECDT